MNVRNNESYCFECYQIEILVMVSMLFKYNIGILGSSCIVLSVGV